MHQHYCGGNLKKVSFFTKNNSCHEEKAATMMVGCKMHQASCKLQKVNGACCEDITSEFKIKDNFKQASQSQVETKPILIFLYSFAFSNSFWEETESAKYLVFESPPRKTIPAFLLNSQFIFYG